MKDIIGIVALGVLLGLGFWAGFYVGAASENIDWKNWTVDSGLAEYYLSDTHEKVWRWKVQ